MSNDPVIHVRLIKDFSSLWFNCIFLYNLIWSVVIRRRNFSSCGFISSWRKYELILFQTKFPLSNRFMQKIFIKFIWIIFQWYCVLMYSKIHFGLSLLSTINTHCFYLKDFALYHKNKYQQLFCFKTGQKISIDLRYLHLNNTSVWLATHADFIHLLDKTKEKDFDF